MATERRRVRRSLLIIALASVLAAACATNPVTGKKQFTLMSEAQEIAIGEQMDPEVRQEFGVYDDRELQGYVEEIGMQLARLVQMVVDQGVRRDTKGVVDRRQQLARVHRVFDRRRAGLIGFAVNVPPLDPRAGQPCTETLRVMVAAVPLGARSAPELGAPDDERVVEQAALLEVDE